MRPDSPLLGLSQRMLPANVEAEQGVLGAILASPEAMTKIEGMLEPKHFIDPINAMIFENALRRVKYGRLVDVVTMAGDFQGTGLLDAVGGNHYLAQLVGALISPRIVREYALAVLDAWKRRQMIAMAESMVEQAFANGDVQEAIGIASTSLDDIASVGGARSTAVSIGDAVDMALAEADAVARGESITGVLTGMKSIDDALGGMEAGNLVVVGGRPGSGKSSLAWQWAIDIARRGQGVLAVSMEMTARALGRRALSTVSGIPLWRMKRGQHGDVIGPLLEARKELLGLPLSIQDGGRASSTDMLDMAREARRKHGLRMIVVDHLQIAKPEDTDQRNGSTAAVAGVAHAMKELAKRMECPVVLLSQLSRALEARDDHRPTIADLRQSGAIEEDADIVAFVYRPELHMAKSPPEQTERETGEKYQERVNAWHARKERIMGTAEFIIEKLRDGEPKALPLLFEGQTTRFREPAEVGA